MINDQLHLRSFMIIHNDDAGNSHRDQPIARFLFHKIKALLLCSLSDVTIFW
jgi:hypothetical protein